MRSVSGAVFTVAGLVLALGAAGCAATSPSAYRDRDEPINRTTGTGQEYYGTVTRVDEPQRVVVLDNGQMYRVSGDRSVFVNGQPVVLGRLQPGTPVTITSGTPVVYQNGQYVTVAPGSVVTAPAGTVVTAPPGTVVTAPPGTVVAAPTGSTLRMVGRVADVENSGNVKVRLPDGRALEFPAPVGTVVRKGDPVTIDMTFGAPAPSALPR
jgi:hypothetical protein